MSRIPFSVAVGIVSLCAASPSFAYIDIPAYSETGEYDSVTNPVSIPRAGVKSIAQLSISNKVLIRFLSPFEQVLAPTPYISSTIRSQGATLYCTRLCLDLISTIFLWRQSDS